MGLFSAALSIAPCACSHDASSGHGEGAVTAPQGADCGHTACGANFFVDAAQTSDCAVGANCALALTLVATGDFHINDEYPYKFRAEETPRLSFQGTDSAGPKVFSKAANNWQKTAPQKGVMTLVMQAAEKGDKPVSGVFKLSVCSAQNCQLEQTEVTTSVHVR
jgi:hypothetical protein